MLVNPLIQQAGVFLELHAQRDDCMQWACRKTRSFGENVTTGLIVVCLWGCSGVGMDEKVPNTPSAKFWNTLMCLDIIASTPQKSTQQLCVRANAGLKLV